MLNTAKRGGADIILPALCSLLFYQLLLSVNVIRTYCYMHVTSRDMTQCLALIQYNNNTMGLGDTTPTNYVLWWAGLSSQKVGGGHGHFCREMCVPLHS